MEALFGDGDDVPSDEEDEVLDAGTVVPRILAKFIVCGGCEKNAEDSSFGVLFRVAYHVGSVFLTLLCYRTVARLGKHGSPRCKNQVPEVVEHSVESQSRHTVTWHARFLFLQGSHSRCIFRRAWLTAKETYLNRSFREFCVCFVRIHNTSWPYAEAKLKIVSLRSPSAAGLSCKSA
jgi:hypothetical protein